MHFLLVIIAKSLAFKSEYKLHICLCVDFVDQTD
jgi:hypothetical protein